MTTIRNMLAVANTPARRMLAYRLLLLAFAAATVGALLLTASYFSRPLHWFGLSDHTLHFCGHVTVWGMLGLVVCLGMDRRYVFAWLITLLVAALEEYHQRFIPGRTCDIVDWLVNFASISTTISLLAIFDYTRRLLAHRSPTSPATESSPA
ncbi:MAG: VanZ family protein [Phycisphaeraceae bacterium]|nr:VanZ family protein [Phycisphaeraceae bacterium]